MLGARGPGYALGFQSAATKRRLNDQCPVRVGQSNDDPVWQVVWKHFSGTLVTSSPPRVCQQQRVGK
jgi:hypothetical protein